MVIKASVPKSFFSLLQILRIPTYSHWNIKTESKKMKSQQSDHYSVLENSHPESVIRTPPITDSLSTGRGINLSSLSIQENIQSSTTLPQFVYFASWISLWLISGDIGLFAFHSSKRIHATDYSKQQINNPPRDSDLKFLTSVLVTFIIQHSAKQTHCQKELPVWTKLNRRKMWSNSFIFTVPSFTCYLITLSDAKMHLRKINTLLQKRSSRRKMVSQQKLLNTNVNRSTYMHLIYTE